MSKTIAVGILGGTGYGAGELLRLLIQHPFVEVVGITSSSNQGAAVSDMHTHLKGFYDLTFDSELDYSRFDGFPHKLVFSGLPHGISAEQIAKVLEDAPFKDLKIIDLSGDFRLRNQELHQAFYPETPFTPELRSRFTYGLSELAKTAIKQSQLIANPGCLSSTSILAVAPIVNSNYQGQIVIDAKTGTSGAGKNPQPSMHHPGRHGNFTAYKVLEHRHEPEILQGLGDPQGKRVTTSFVPHLLPTSRGIFVTAYCTLDRETSTEELFQSYRLFYKDSPFIRLRDEVPGFQHVIGSNFCDLAVKVRGRQVVVMAVLDNLVKGMAGQAIQNMNLICDLPETSGLWHASLGIM